MTLYNNVKIYQKPKRPKVRRPKRVHTPRFDGGGTKLYETGYFRNGFQTFFDDSFGIVQNNHPIPSAWIPLTSFFNGVQNPSHKAQIRLGFDATTGASGRQYNILPFFYDAQCLVAYKGNPGKFAGNSIYGYPDYPGLFTLPVSPPASLVTSVTNRAIRKILDKADAVRSSFESGQDLGEIRETIRSIKHPMQSARDFLVHHLDHSIKRLRKVNAIKDFTKVAADSFLEFKFGWNPLASDIAQGFADLTNNQNHFDSVPMTASASDTWQVATPSISPVIPGSGLFHPVMYGRVTGRYTVRFKGGVRTGAVNGRIGTLQNLQLDLPHVLPTLWDLVPYSWLIDYFANLGDLIRAYSFQAFDWTYLCKTVRTEIAYEFAFPLPDIQPAAAYDPVSVTMNPGHPEFSQVDFARVRASSSSLIPDFTFQVPLGSEKPWENMTALLLGRQKVNTELFTKLRR
jgi:hypothetical protein